jgi:hypothetical protein
MGIGLWDVFVMTKEGIGSLTLLNSPLGVDWNLKSSHFIGTELDLNYALYCKSPDSTHKINRRFVPLPGFCYKCEL